MDPSPLLPLVIVVLLFLGWRVVRRARRDVGRRQLHAGRLIAQMAVLALLTGVVTYATLPNLVSLEAEFAGLALGSALACVGLKLTRFEMTAEGSFYIPNSYIGIALTLLFVGRLAYRLLSLAPAPGGIAARSPALLQSPLTLLIFGVTVGYYIAYSAGILLRGRKILGAPSFS